LIDPSKYLDHRVDSAKNKTKLKHPKASFSTSAANGPKNCSFFLSLWMTLKTTRIWSFVDVCPFHVTPNCISLSNSKFILTFHDIVIFMCQLWPKYDFNADLYLLQRKIWRDKKNINMTMNGGQIRFYLRIYCRTLGMLFKILPKGRGEGMCPLPPAHMSLIRKDSGEH
jgi:hypothetical protein